MNPTQDAPANPQSVDRHAALFANLVMQNANMAMLFLGRMPHPESGKTELNLDAASMFIDTLEMLEAKTRGNLDADEANILKETLTTLRFSFVQAAEKAPAVSEGADQPAESSGEKPKAAVPAEGAATPADADERKKFVKRY
jgi:hypothetical protein